MRKCYRFSVNLHPEKDADIIGFMTAFDNRQGLVKAALRYYERGLILHESGKCNNTKPASAAQQES